MLASYRTLSKMTRAVPNAQRAFSTAASRAQVQSQFRMQVSCLQTFDFPPSARKQ